LTKVRDSYPMAVYVIPKRDNEILVAQRYNTGYGDGFYSFAAGHVERGESVTQTAIRESEEEIGILLNEDALQFGHVLHRCSDDGIIYCDFFFVVEKWEGTPAIMEPHRCDGIRWVPIDTLPENTLPYIRHVVEQIFVGRCQFSQFGWA